ncbi:unnamed protein product [Lathyrus sativus]|nr:unnamed protein product [Lathyrus sativus]
MRASLTWTINDFLAYVMLSKWGRHGKMGCPHCMGNTKVLTLEKGGKVRGLTVTIDSYQEIIPLEETRLISKKINE